MIDVDEHKYQQILEYLELMLEANQNINLTRISDIDQGKLLHIDDSLLALRFFDESLCNNDSRILDLGSGCGFPGVALSIATGIPTTLVDSVSKKMIAVGQILQKCGLQDTIQTVSSRIEELDVQTCSSNFVVSRAMASLPAVMELATPLIYMGGLLIVYKGDISDDETCQGLDIQDILGLQLQEEFKTSLGDDEFHRSLFAFKKISEPSIKLPRRNGKAQKNPLTVK